MCYTLTTSWYFWIIRILVGMAIVAPFLKKVSDRISTRKLLLIITLLFGMSELLALLSSSYFYKVAIMFIPYSAIYLIGMNVRKFTDHSIMCAGILITLLYIAIALYFYYQTGEYVPTNKYKYPPRIYYISYALGISALLFYFRVRITSFFQKLRLYDFAKFVGSHTFWIYLWHIPFVDYMVKRYDFLITFVTVYLLAITITYFQVMLVNKLCNGINRPDLRKNLQMIFIG